MFPWNLSFTRSITEFIIFPKTHVPRPVCLVLGNITQPGTWESLPLPPHHSPHPINHQVLPFLLPCFSFSQAVLNIPTLLPSSDHHHLSLGWHHSFLTGLSILVPGLDPPPAPVKSINKAAKVIFLNCPVNEHHRSLQWLLIPEDGIKAPCLPRSGFISLSHSVT